MRCNPVFVVRIDTRTVDAPLGPPGVVTWKTSARPYPTSASYEGPIVGGVIEIGDLTQAMSDRNGSPTVNGFAFTWWDRGNYWRTVLADPNTQYLTGQEITLLFAADAWLRDEDVPLFPLFRGQLLDPSPRPQKQFSFAAESRLGTRKGPYDMDSPVNKVTAQRAVDDGFPAVPRENVEKRLPALWGEKTDSGVRNEFNDLVESGMCPAVNLGPLPGTEPQFLPKPEWGTPQKYLHGTAVSLATALGSRTYTYIFGARTTDGQWSLSDPLTLTGMPSPDDFEDEGAGHRGFGTGVRLFVVPYANPAHMALITNTSTGDFMGNLWVKDGDAGSAAPYRHMDGAGEAFTIGYDDNGDDSHYKPFGPRLPQRPLAQTNPDAGDFWCFLRHPGLITKLFGSDLGGGTAIQENEDSLPPGSEAKYTQLSPDIPGVDLGDEDTGKAVLVNGHYYFGVVLSGAIGLAAKDDGFPPRANLCGWHGGNDLLINQAAYIAQDVIVQMTGGPHGRGSEDGTRLPIPSFSSFPFVPIVQTSRFQAVQDTTKGFLSTDLGYIGCVYFGPDDASAWREHWQQVWIDWGFDRFENEHGQEAISVMDDTLSLDEGVLLRELIELDGVEDAGAVRSQEIQNIEKYETGWHPIENVYRSGVLEIRDAISVAQYGERWRGGNQDAKASHKYTDDPATARDAASRYLADRAIGPSYPAVVGKLQRMIPIALGSQIRIQHSDLITSAPIPVYLRERTISASRGTITLRGRSRQRESFVSVVASADAPAYADASDTERAVVFYVSDANGLLPDGTPGSRLR